MNHVWKKGSALLLTAVLGASLSACGAKTDSAAGGKTDGAASGGSKPAASGDQGQQKAPAGKVTINVLTQSIEPKDVVDKFQKEHPEIEVKWEQVDTANISQTMKTRIAAGGENLDIMTPQKADFEPMAKSGVFLDLSGASFLSSYEPAAVEAGKVGGKLYGIPLTQQAYLVWYNQDIFKKYNLSEPKNWDEFLSVCETLKKNGVPPIVLAGKEGYVVSTFAGLPYSGLFASEPDWLTKVAKGDVKWTDDGSVEALKRIKTLVDKGYLLEGALGTGYDQAYQAFYQGKAAMEVNGAWSIDLIVKNTPQFALGAFIPPGNAKDQQQKVAFVPGNTISIAATSKHPEESKKFLEFLSKPEIASMLASDLKQFSSVKGTSADFHPATKLLQPIFAAEKTNMLHAQMTPTVNSMFYKTIQKIVDGETTPEQAAKDIQAAQDKDVKK